MPNHPISIPAGYAPAFAVGFSADTGELSVVDNAKPLPVTLAGSEPTPVRTGFADAPPPLEGQASEYFVVGPYVAVAGRPIIVNLSGAWTGTIHFRRSTDGGAITHGLTVGGLEWGVFRQNACEQVWVEEEDGVEFYLVGLMASGTITYRVSQ